MVNGLIDSFESEEGGLGDLVNDLLASLESEESGLGGVVNGIFDSLGLKENGLSDMLNGVLDALKSEESSIGDAVSGILSSLESEESSLGDVVNGILDSFRSKEFSPDDVYGGMSEEADEDMGGLIGRIFSDDFMDSSLDEYEESAEYESEAAEESIEEEAAEEEEEEEESDEHAGFIGDHLKELTGAFISGLNLDLSQDEQEDAVELFSDSNTLKDLMADLFAKDAPGTEFLDSLSEQKEGLASLIDSLKDEDGGYSLGKIAKALKSATQAEDGEGVVIEGVEISNEELSEYVEMFFHSLGFGAN
jgi:hypothetical protein